MQVESVTGDNYLEWVYLFTPKVKRHGQLKLVETLKPYSLTLTNEKGNLINDKTIWGQVEQALNSYNGGNSRG